MATYVDSLETIIPTFFKPTKAINRPIPADTACFIPEGMALIIVSLILVIVKIKNATPEIKTAPRAVCHGTPIPNTTVYVK